MVSWKDSVAFWLCGQEFCLTERNGLTREAQLTVGFIVRKQHAAQQSWETVHLRDLELEKES